jgi:hypothetical protein
MVSKTQLLLPSILPLRIATLGSRIVTFGNKGDGNDATVEIIMMIQTASSSSNYQNASCETFEGLVYTVLPAVSR